MNCPKVFAENKFDKNANHTSIDVRVGLIGATIFLRDLGKVQIYFGVIMVREEAYGGIPPHASTDTSVATKHLTYVPSPTMSFNNFVPLLCHSYLWPHIRIHC